MTDVTRRTVLAAGAGLLGLAIVGTATGEADAATGSGPVRADYTGSLGATFTAAGAGRTHRLKLRHIRDLTPTTAKHRPYCFNLIFVPVGSAALPDGIYTVRRRGVPTHSLFLSRAGSGHALQAIVNRRA